MAVKKEKSAGNTGLKTLKDDLKSGDLKSVYIFYGEESYLRSHYFEMLKAKVVPEGFGDFNYHRLNGKEVTVQTVFDSVEALPMMSDKTLVAVSDMDIFKLDEKQRGQIISMLEDFPPYCCLVFLYDTVTYKPDGKMKKLVSAIKEYVQVVEFSPQGQSDLINWVTRHFENRGKQINRAAAEHMIFTCGSLMNGLLTEIEKLSAYAKGKEITIDDINAVCEPVTEAVIYNITNCISAGNYNKAAEELSKLLKNQEEPIVILSLIGKELRKLYIARIALDGGKNYEWVADVCGMRSTYPAKLAISSAKNFSKEWCRSGVSMCRKLDLDMKSKKGINNEDELKMLLMKLANGTKE